eukprot:6881425-Prymnesium_polylepis.1
MRPSRRRTAEAGSLSFVPVGAGGAGVSERRLSAPDAASPDRRSRASSSELPASAKQEPDEDPGGALGANGGAGLVLAFGWNGHGQL